MRPLAILLLGALLAAFSPPAFAADAPPAKARVLLITGDDVMPAHNWPEVSAVTREILVSSGKFEVVVCEDPGILDSATSLARYDLIFLAMYNAKTPTISDAAKENLLNFVKGGKGLTVAHLANASFKEWAEFRNLCGRVWVMGKSGHGSRAPFKVKVVNQTSPITQGLEDFIADDELYAKLEGDAPINVLLEADSDWSKKTEPLAYTHEYGQGRVFYEAFGHDRKALDNPSIRTLIVRGCEWAATGKVK